MKTYRLILRNGESVLFQSEGDAALAADARAAAQGRSWRSAELVEDEAQEAGEEQSPEPLADTETKKRRRR